MAKKKTATKASPTGRELVLRGDRMRLLREAKGWTQLEVSYRAKLAPRQVTQAETGQIDLSLAAFKRVALALECSSDYLLGLSEKP